MSAQFESALAHHSTLPYNTQENRASWHSYWAAICRDGHLTFMRTGNQIVPNYVAAAVCINNVTIGREVMGLVEHNRLMALVNELTVKFNKGITNQDVLAAKVKSALDVAINEGRYR